MHDKNIYSDGQHVWSIDAIREQAKGGQVQQVSVADVRETDTVEWLLACLRRVREADPEEPVILGPDGQLLFGNCQMVKAKLDGRATVKAIRLAFMPEPLTIVHNRRAG